MSVVIAELRLDGQTIGAVNANEHEFKTGSKGFYGLGKIKMGGKRYQASVSLVEIHSKPGTDQPESPA